MEIKDDIFCDFKTQIFKKQNTKDNTVDSSSQAQSTISAYMDFVYNGSAVTRRYHYEIMKQAQLLLVVFSALFIMVTIFICIMIGFVIIRGNYKTATLIPLLAGIGTDLFSGALIIVMKSLIKSRDDFFKENVKAEHFSKIIGLIQTIEKDSDKKDFIKKIVDDYCGNNRTPHS